MYNKVLQRKLADLFLEVLASPVEVTKNLQVRLSPVLLTTPHQEGVRERFRQIYIANRQAQSLNEHMQTVTRGVGVSEREPGCGLAFVTSKIRENYNDKDHRNNYLSARLIGENAIALAKYSY